MNEYRWPSPYACDVNMSLQNNKILFAFIFVIYRFYGSDGVAMHGTKIDTKFYTVDDILPDIFENCLLRININVFFMSKININVFHNVFFMSKNWHGCISRLFRSWILDKAHANDSTFEFKSSLNLILLYLCASYCLM